MCCKYNQGLTGIGYQCLSLEETRHVIYTWSTHIGTQIDVKPCMSKAAQAYNSKYGRPVIFVCTKCSSPYDYSPL